ncbi:MAG: hypothetical protein RSB12_00595 [Peptostreptococcaceae bacterium]
MKLKLGILIAALSLTLVGCSSTEAGNDKEKENQTTQNEIKEDVESDKDNDNIAKEEEKSKEEKLIDFKIYTADVEDTEKIVELETIKLKENTSVDEKLNELCKALQTKYFKTDTAEITLESIDEDNIAIINLKGQEAWRQYFQGSTGGIISQTTITETLLQKEYKGDWIKGVKILVDGETKDVFDHASFLEPFYR